jgi:DNA polymerase-1
LTKPDKYEKLGVNDPFPVRRAMVPREGCYFWMPDYDQMEYRMFVDIAGAYSVINKILKEKLDVHEATAQLANISRSDAKNVNFASVYGAGLGKLAAMLKTSEDDARRVKKSVFDAAPELLVLIEELKKNAKVRGKIFAWSGRMLQFPDPAFAYKAPNHFIQGGCADVVKQAMEAVDQLLVRENSGVELVLQIHDELVFEVPIGENHLLPEIRNIMETRYPYQYLKLTTSVEYSDLSLADKKDWVQ